MLEHDGNLTDAAILAMSAALGQLQLPVVRYDEALESLVVEEAAADAPPAAAALAAPAPAAPKPTKRKRAVEAAEPVAAPSATAIAAPAEADGVTRRIELGQVLLPVSFGVLSGHLLLDSTADEESHLSCAFTVLIDSDGQVSGPEVVPRGEVGRVWGVVSGAERREYGVQMVGGAVTSFNGL